MAPETRILEPYRELSGNRLPLEQITDWEGLVIEAKYSQRSLAKITGYSVRHLQRHILDRYKKKLSAFISGIRLQKAYILLKSGFSIKQTALGLGYKQVSHFCRCFKRHFDATASCVLASSGRHDHPDESGEHQLQLELFQPRKPSPGTRNRQSRADARILRKRRGR
jgi:transcriptional regulator GlxA family with amidase domain